ncbi:CYFA0S02e00254g1_1 [Cyberlindnera fabianii]|uniref:CYFA0S02e00254g1_1 n=1 Tax=Cyberlindnera fabianii TaxID=36022 RepID=A0A061AUB6_CYBFA|nr:CYFA0S02e00254g1_1 [Cyberlindnera fabianii]
MSNLFELLGNDVEDVNDVSLPREIVKKNTSSKKTDTPPPSANPARANKNRPQPTGNEAAIKNKDTGRSANKAKDVQERPAKSGKPSKDRRSRSGKTDSEKKFKQAGWTADAKSELKNEEEAAEDVAEEIAEDSEPKVAKKSLEEYLKEKEAAAAAANSQREGRKVEAVNEEDIIVKEQEVFVPASKEKKVKSKALKTKNFLDFDATFSDDLPKASPRTSAPRGRGQGPKRGSSAPRGARGAAKAGPKKSAPQLTEENFPSLA